MPLFVHLLSSLLHLVIRGSSVISTADGTILLRSLLNVSEKFKQ